MPVIIVNDMPIQYYYTGGSKSFWERRTFGTNVRHLNIILFHIGQIIYVILSHVGHIRRFEASLTLLYT